MGVAGDVLCRTTKLSGLLMRLAQFPSHVNSPLVIKAFMTESKTVDFIQYLVKIGLIRTSVDSIPSTTANGIVILGSSADLANGGYGYNTGWPTAAHRSGAGWARDGAVVCRTDGVIDAAMLVGQPGRFR